MKTKSIFYSLMIFAVLLAACSSATPTPQAVQPTQASQNNSAPTTAASETFILLGQSAELGSFLVDSKGMTLYLFTKDTLNTSNCYDACATAWPPLQANGNVQAGQGVEGAKLGTTKRTDGPLQVTYNGWPLYYYAKDQKAGDTTGEDVNQVWYVVSAAGDKVEPPVAAANSRLAAAPQSTATSPAVSSSDVSITISNFTFDPSPLTIKIGTTVTWTNLDAASHNVVADNGVFKSQTLGEGDAFSFTFTQEGTYSYYCSFHGGQNGKGMSGQIIVTP